MSLHESLRANGDAALAHISNALDDLQYSPDQRPVPLLHEAMHHIREMMAALLSDRQEVAPVAYDDGTDRVRDYTGQTSDARDSSVLVAAAKRLDKFSLVILSSVTVEDPEFAERVGAALVDLRNAALADPDAVKYRKALERVFDCGRFPEGHHSAGDHEFCGSHHADCIAIAREALRESSHD